MVKRRCLSKALCLFTYLLGRLFLVDGFVERHWSTRSHARPLCSTLRHAAGDCPQRRTRQIRRKSVNRRPPKYWKNLENVHDEFTQFWNHLNVTIPENEAPPIPNEGLLNHFDRHDLRYAIVSYGGRKSLSARLGGARIMPGKWTTAVQQSPELGQLLTNATHGLSRHIPPLSPQQKKQLMVGTDTFMHSEARGSHREGRNRKGYGTTVIQDLHHHLEISPQQQKQVTMRTDTFVRNRTRWMHHEGRKPKGYWSLALVIQELYQCLDDYQERSNRPSVWMPRPKEFANMGRDDLRQAIVRFGGSTKICKLARLIPYREWHYFEGQYELLVELRDYLDTYHNGNRTYFPSASAMKHHGYHQLYSLTQYFGGSKFLANRLSMSYTNAPRHYADMNWGPFSIDTAIELYRFVRADQMKKKGPLRRPVIAIPSQTKLLANGQEQLHKNITELGGYESLARRLGLDFPG